jgi:hypothetical protein
MPAGSWVKGVPADRGCAVPAGGFNLTPAEGMEGRQEAGGHCPYRASIGCALKAPRRPLWVSVEHRYCHAGLGRNIIAAATVAIPAAHRAGLVNRPKSWGHLSLRSLRAGILNAEEVDH